MHSRHNHEPLLSIHTRTVHKPTVRMSFPDLHDQGVNIASEARIARCGAISLMSVLQRYVEKRLPIPLPGPVGEGQRTIALPATRVLKVHLYNTMLERGMTKADLARLLKKQPPSIDRLLDMTHNSSSSTLDDALHALGLEVRLAVVPRPQNVVLQKNNTANRGVARCWNSRHNTSHGQHANKAVTGNAPHSLTTPIETEHTMIKFDKATARTLSAEFIQEVAELAKRHGIVVQPHGGTVGDTYLDLKFRFTNKADCRAGRSAKARGARHLGSRSSPPHGAPYADVYRLPLNGVGRKVNVNGEQMSIVGFAPNRPKFPVVVMNAQGKTFKTTVATVASQLK
ncbi:hypothetical protein [Ralstonia phage phiRSL1]|uniref:Uncharacterized protein n=1 Tax=Ralstonia phage phiRSL1 TaxID=1980924 RepID=B2ZYG3_9CAUD|nr:toxin-antitoxin system HicB-like [Ralstonia phage phiRSL1]BAG41762.2 hypothetical protein [Ralstonia phage phiRSL1]